MAMLFTLESYPLKVDFDSSCPALLPWKRTSLRLSVFEDSAAVVSGFAGAGQFPGDEPYLQWHQLPLLLLLLSSVEAREL